ncbi:alpha-ketoglutarate-dependent dioxygenase AlkB family protein [Marinobacterium weihaiense]|uniref:Alpha-ketoglutarate-dependent dioxygenase AlkB n=1 Tax=Marinobacterium weihaiense TaxID=2851016 RepID=A0ABS6MD68_9GAMM|nr:alpha-ketoglutarate-dependent dioxygenase AlkB [Marinobacterium weihaiense]MBV0934242.1 alpha-ketoglutarate-dependent dioxygenase AlkB [Marinobacterium weihaiense]
MDLFMTPDDNLLDRDGEAVYLGPVLSRPQADAALAQLLREIDWQADEVIMFGRRRLTRRKTAWHGEVALAYTYAGVTRRARPWTPLLRRLKAEVEAHAGCRFNACLLNLYHDGSEGMSWHRDNEPDLEPGAAIASLSLGAERPFMFRHRETDARVEVLLEHGSLLVMKGATQTFWQHALPVRKRIEGVRVNLTFRCMRESGH